MTAYIDGGARGNPGPAGYGAHIVDDAGEVVAELHGALGIATNNVAEYNGLLAALQWARRAWRLGPAREGRFAAAGRADARQLSREERGPDSPVPARARPGRANRPRHLRAHPARAEQGRRPSVQPRDGRQQGGHRSLLRSQFATRAVVIAAQPDVTMPRGTTISAAIRPARGAVGAKRLEHLADAPACSGPRSRCSPVRTPAAMS